MFGEGVLKLALLAIGVIAILVCPLMLIAYVRYVLPQRRGQIRQGIADRRAREAFVKLFGAQSSRVPDVSAKDHSAAVRQLSDPELDRVILADFDSIHALGKYVWGQLLVQIVVAVAVGVCLDAAWHEVVATAPTGPRPVPTVAVMALAGAFVWSIFDMLCRFRARDLCPDDLFELTHRYLAAVPIAIAVSAFGDGGFVAMLAFASAAFPLREVRRLLRERVLKKLDVAVAGNARVAEGHLGLVVDGISDAALARLEEIGIVTYLDIAYANPMRVTAVTGYPFRRVLAWIDQALLAVYVPQLKVKLTGVGLPCALDVAEFYEAHCWDPVAKKERDWATDNAVLELACRLDLPSPFVPEFCRRVAQDPHVCFLRMVWDSAPACDRRGD